MAAAVDIKDRSKSLIRWCSVHVGVGAQYTSGSVLSTRKNSSMELSLRRSEKQVRKGMSFTALAGFFDGPSNCFLSAWQRRINKSFGG